jgi:hypothetical protein
MSSFDAADRCGSHTAGSDSELPVTVLAASEAPSKSALKPRIVNIIAALSSCRVRHVPSSRLQLPKNGKQVEKKVKKEKRVKGSKTRRGRLGEKEG